MTKAELIPSIDENKRLSRRRLLMGLPLALPLALAASPAKASMGSGRYLDSRTISGPYVISGMDADALLLIGSGDVYLDDAFPIGSGFGVMKDADSAGIVTVHMDGTGINGYTKVVFHIRSMGGDFYRTNDGWRWFPYGPETAPLGTLHRTVVAPTPGNSDFIDPDENNGKIIRYNCQNGSLFVVIPDPLPGRWGLPAQYRSAIKVAIQRVDTNWNTSMTMAVQGGGTINNQPNLMFPPLSAAELYSDGNAWRIMSSHNL